MPSFPTVRVSLTFLAIALVGLLFADIAVTTADPWRDLGNFLFGLATPNFFSTEGLMTALLRTVAFAFVGVALGSAAGFLMALAYRSLPVRIFCAFIRAIHELFWALIFLQFFGFHPLTGVLAIAIPYAGIFAKVYSDILDEADPESGRVLPPGTGTISAFLYARIPDCWAKCAPTPPTGWNAAFAPVPFLASLACQHWAFTLKRRSPKGFIPTLAQC